MTKMIGLSTPAAKAFASMQDKLCSLSVEHKWSHSTSASVTVEFLVWWWERTVAQRTHGVDRLDFRPKTRAGRPMKPAGEKSTDRPVAPSTIRKLAGLDRRRRGGKL